MLVVHAPAFLGAWRALLLEGDAARVGACVWLTASMALFALKAARVRLLRFSAQPRAVLALTTAIVLIHAHNLAPQATDELAAAPIAATSLFVIGLKRVAPRDNDDAAERRRRARVDATVARTCAISPWRPGLSHAGAAVQSPRPPPLCR